MTADDWATPAATTVPHSAPADTPPARFMPYIGDYIRLLAVDADFFGVCGSRPPVLGPMRVAHYA